MNSQSKTIVFIHGLFMNPASWQHWIEYYEAKGYQCFAPAYPYHAGNPADLRKKIDPALGKVTFGEVIDSLSTFIDTLPEEPLLIGHSMGGLAVQKLISMGKGVAGICISPAPPKGISVLTRSFLKANFPVINPFKGDSVFVPSPEWFHHAFCHTIPQEFSTIVYNHFAVPESRNIARSSRKKDGYIDFSKPHQPLLIIAGEQDRIVPAALNKKNYNAYTDPGSKRDFKEFPGRTHFICGQLNWEQVAQYIYDWIAALK